MIGTIINQWLILEDRPGGHYLCKCSCGKIKLVRKHSIINGKSRSCNCLRIKGQKERARIRHSKLDELLMDCAAFEPNTGCWLWTRSTLQSGGYGVISLNKKPHRVHVLSYRLFVGEIGPGMFVCHKCDTPPCFNPDHLFLGTQADNMRDASKKKRFRACKVTHCPQGHEYSGWNLILYNGSRYCRACVYARNRKRGGV